MQEPRGYSEPAAAYGCGCEHLVKQRFDAITRQSKTDPAVLAIVADHCRIDADYITSKIQQGPSRIAGVNGDIGLNVLVINLPR